MSNIHNVNDREQDERAVCTYSLWVPGWNHAHIVTQGAFSSSITGTGIVHGRRRRKGEAAFSIVWFQHGLWQSLAVGIHFQQLKYKYVFLQTWLDARIDTCSLLMMIHTFATADIGQYKGDWISRSLLQNFDPETSLCDGNILILSRDYWVTYCLSVVTYIWINPIESNCNVMCILWMYTWY